MSGIRNRSGVRVEQIGFRLLVSVVWLVVAVYMLVVLTFVG